MDHVQDYQSKNQKFECKSCGISKFHTINPNQHITHALSCVVIVERLKQKHVHEGKKSIKSSKSPKTRRNDLKKYVNSLNKEERPFKCPKCSKTFKQKARMMSHIAIVHEGKKPFECDSCGKTFDSALSHMFQHLQAVKT